MARVALLLGLLAGCGLAGAVAYAAVARRRHAAATKADLEGRVQRLRYLVAILNHVFDAVEQDLRPGVTPQALAAFMENLAHGTGVRSSVRGFRGFPEPAAISVNKTFLNGLPDQEPIREGDVVHIQFGVTDGKAYAHQSWAYEIGAASAEWRTVVSAALQGLENAATVARGAGLVGDVSRAIKSAADEAGCHPNREYMGCGIWDQPFGWPPIPGWPDPRSARIRLPMDQAILVQSIMHAGSPETVIQPDHWGTNSADGRPAAALSQMLLLSPGGVETLTPIRRTRIEATAGHSGSSGRV